MSDATGAEFAQMVCRSSVYTGHAAMLLQITQMGGCVF